jgi:hypothetical protein
MRPNWWPCFSANFARRAPSPHCPRACPNGDRECPR